MIVLLRPEADAETVAALVRRIQDLGLEAIPLDEGRGRALEVVGPGRGAALALHDAPGVLEILTRRTRLEGGEPVWPHFLLRLSIRFALLVGALLLLTAFAGPGLGDLAEPSAAAAPAATEWYLRPLASFLALFPEGLRWLAGALTLMFWILLFAWPFLDRAPQDTPEGRRLIRAGRVAATVLLVFLVILALRPLA